MYLLSDIKIKELSSPISLQADSPLIQIQNLTANATYNISATVMHPDYQYTNAEKSGPMETLTKGYKPREVKNITHSELKLSETSNKTFDTFVLWEPADDRTCHYFIYMYDTAEKDTDMRPKLINKVNKYAKVVFILNILYT